MKLDEEGEDRLEAVEGRVATIEQRFKEAFPNGDWSGHRQYHEVQIEILLENRRLRAAIIEKTAIGVVWLGLGLIGTMAWFWFLKQIATGLGKS